MGVPTGAPTTTTKKSPASFCGLPCTPATWEADCGGSCGLCDGVMCTAGYAPTTTTALTTATTETMVHITPVASATAAETTTTVASTTAAETTTTSHCNRRCQRRQRKCGRPCQI